MHSCSSSVPGSYLPGRNVSINSVCLHIEEATHHLPASVYAMLGLMAIQPTPYSGLDTSRALDTRQPAAAFHSSSSAEYKVPVTEYL